MWINNIYIAFFNKSLFVSVYTFFHGKYFFFYSWSKNSYFPLRSLVTISIWSLLSFVHFFPCEVASDAYPYGAPEFAQIFYLGCPKILVWYNGFSTIIAVFVIFLLYLLVLWIWWFQGACNVWNKIVLLSCGSLVSISPFRIVGP